MSARILTGKEVADTLLGEVRQYVKEIDPKLVVVQVGDDPASTSYIRQKLKTCQEVGMRSEHIHLSDHTTLIELMQMVDRLNRDDDVTGFIVQLPLPSQLAHHVLHIVRAINPMKDIDGFGAVNLGKTFLSAALEQLPPATPSGIVTMLEYYNIPIEGQHAVILGRSNIVGKPLAVMLLNRGATVTVCHSRTPDIGVFTRQADIICSAVGKPNLITADMVKPGATVIDIGVTKVDGLLQGDADYDNLLEVAGAITPVPGGVGPMTVASLIRNCLHAKRLQMNEK